MSHQHRVCALDPGCKLLIVAGSLSLLGLSQGAAGSITVEVFPSSAPNALGSPSWGGYLTNAMNSLENGLGDIGDRSTDPTAYEIAPPVVQASEFMVTSYPSWRGTADPSAPFASERGNRIHFGLHAYGDGTMQFTLEDLEYDMQSSDPFNALGFVGDFTGLSYDGTNRYGIDWGPDRMKGGGDDVVYTSGNGTTLVDEVVYRGIGNAFWPGGGDPDPQNPINGRQGAMDDAVAWVISQAPFTFSCEYTILGFSGEAQVLVLPGLTGTDPTKANGDFIAGTGIPSDKFWRVSDGSVSSFLKARARSSGEPLSVVGNRYRVLTGTAPSTSVAWWSVDFQFTPDLADAAGGPPNYRMEFKIDTDPTAGASFTASFGPFDFFDGDVDGSNSWDDTDGYFVNPGGGAWSDDVTPYVYSQSWRHDFGFLVGSILPAGLYDVEFNVADAGGSPIISNAIEVEVVPAELQLIAQDDCLDATESQLVVDVYLSGTAQPVGNGQYLLAYDNATLDFVSADPGDAPFGSQVIEIVDELNGTIVYATGNFGGSTTSNPTVVARLTFDVIGDAEFCPTSGLVTFRDPGVGEQPTRLTDSNNANVLPATLDLPAVQNDNTAPTLSIPSDISVNADAGLCEATLSVGTPTATDNCTPDADIQIAGVRSDSLALTDPYPAGTTTITWTATDACGNESVDVQTIDVAAFNTIDVIVELASVDPSPAFDRCITFEVFPVGGGAPVIVNETMTFSSGLGTAAIDVPCADTYDCITARDTLHTLTRTDDDDFGISGAVYVADFTSAGSMDDDSLVGGNANDDGFIDILDFGAFSGQFGATLSASTPCGTSPFHTDFDGDGSVGLDDFSFIQINFFALSDAGCGGAKIGVLSGPRTRVWGTPSGEGEVSGGVRPSGPLSRITVAELRRRGLATFAAGDLNHDGVLDEADMGAFVLGARPDHVIDVNGDRVIDLADLSVMLTSFGATTGVHDLDGDGVVGVRDVMLVMDRLGAELSGH